MNIIIRNIAEYIFLLHFVTHNVMEVPFKLSHFLTRQADCQCGVFKKRDKWQWLSTSCSSAGRNIESIGSPPESHSCSDIFTYVCTSRGKCGSMHAFTFQCSGQSTAAGGESIVLIFKWLPAPHIVISSRCSKENVQSLFHVTLRCDYWPTQGKGDLNIGQWRATMRFTFWFNDSVDWLEVCSMHDLFEGNRLMSLTACRTSMLLSG